MSLKSSLNQILLWFLDKARFFEYDAKVNKMPMFAVKDFSFSQFDGLSAGSIMSHSVYVSLTGYKPLAIVGYDISNDPLGSNSSTTTGANSSLTTYYSVRLQEVSADGKSAQAEFRFRNRAASNVAKFYGSCSVLFIRDDFNGLEYQGAREMILDTETNESEDGDD